MRAGHRWHAASQTHSVTHVASAAAARATEGGQRAALQTSAATAVSLARGRGEVIDAMMGHVTEAVDYRVDYRV
jgi:hypothetical protein